MDDKCMNKLLEIISDDNLIDIAKNVKLKIKGFRMIQYKNGVMMPPKKIIINELLKVESQTLINESFGDNPKTRIEMEIEKNSSINEMDREDKEQIVKLLERILSINSKNRLRVEGREIESSTIRNILLDENRVEKLESDEKFINNYSEQIEKLTKDMGILKEKVFELEKKREILEENNKKMTSQIKNIKKEKTILQNENEKIKKENQANIKAKEKYQSEFYSIKKKYDELKAINASQQRDINEKASILERLEGINNNLKNKVNILENKEDERRKKEIKKVVVFGEIYSKEIKEIDKYDICTVEINKLENFKNIINECNEVWILSYDISYLDRIKVEENVDSNKIKEFTSYKKLREYLKKEN